MIINTGARTDTVQYYAPWLLRRFEEGYVLARNPLFPNKVTRYELDPAVVDCVVFCSKDYAPILPHLHRITSRFNTYFYYTITAYGRDIEPGVPSIERSMGTLIKLAEQVGPERVAWRYDPVLLTPTYTLERHREIFTHMADVLTPHVDRCIFSFVEMYKKLRFNMPELMSLSMEDMDELARMLGGIAAEHGLWLQTCGTNGDFSRYGIHPSELPSRSTSWGARTAWSFDRSSTAACARAAIASRRATSAPTTPAPTAAGTAMPTRITNGRPRTTACTTRRARS